VEGWCWYYYWQGVSERQLANLGYLAEPARTAGEYVQIDDGYQAEIGWLTPNEVPGMDGSPIKSTNWASRQASGWLRS
jgi:hypothetical protein